MPSGIRRTRWGARRSTKSPSWLTTTIDPGQLASAVEARGFSLKHRATYYVLDPIPRLDIALMVALGVVTTVAIAWTIANLFVGRIT